MDKDGKVEIKPTGNAGPMLIDGGNVNGLGILDLKSFDRSTISNGKGVFTVRSEPSSSISGDIKLIQLMSSTTVTSGSMTALNIANITAGAGTETAISIGSGWDTDLAFFDNSPIIKIGNGGALSFTDGSNVLLYLSDNGSSGYLGVGTTTPSTPLHVIGTVTATGFIGDGSQLTNVTSTVGAGSVGSAQIIDGAISTADLSGTISVNTTGTIIAGSTTVSTLTTTGSTTVTGTLTAAGGLFTVNGNTGSMTAARITVSGLGTITAGFLSIGTITAETALHGTTTVHFLGGAKFNDTVYFDETNNGDSGASKTIDWKTSNKQKLTITANTTLTFTNPGGSSNLLLVLVQSGAGTGTVSWPASVKWPSGSATTLSTALNAVDIVSCYFDGTNYYCVGSLDFK